MKKILFTAIILIFSERLLAQSSIVQPEVFRLATVATENCPVSDKGKIAFLTNLNTVGFCKGILSSGYLNEYWAGATIDTYYMGKVGINNNNPTYELELGLGTNTRIQNLIVNGNVGMNTLTPTEKLELKDRPILISSTADAKIWAIKYTDNSNRFDIIDNNVSPTSLTVNNGGNISIGLGAGTLNLTNKLTVSGSVSYAGNLTVAGNGIISNTNAAQLKMFTTSFTTSSAGFVISANSCSTTGFGFPNGMFSSPPAVVLGQKISGGTADNGVVILIESGVTQTGGLVKFCNNTNATIGVTNYTYSIIAMGEGN
jgi:hypothetical protein